MTQNAVAALELLDERFELATHPDLLNEAISHVIDCMPELTDTERVALIRVLIDTADAANEV